MTEWLLLLAAILLTGGTAVFVAAEFSLVALDRPTVQKAIDAGDSHARIVLQSLKQLSTQLSAAQVGIGLTVAGLVSFFFAVPAGKLADRVGTKRIWAISALGTSGLYFVWPLLHGFAAFLVMMVVLEVVSQAGWTGPANWTRCRRLPGNDPTDVRRAAAAGDVVRIGPVLSWMTS